MGVEGYGWGGVVFDGLEGGQTVINSRPRHKTGQLQLIQAGLRKRVFLNILVRLSATGRACLPQAGPVCHRQGLSATGRENRTPEPVLPPRVPPRVLVAGLHCESTLVAGMAVSLSKESVRGLLGN